jgi:hypothetical protein
MKLIKGISVLSAAILLAACGGDDNKSSALNTYEFPSKLISGDSSVSHSGQATRHTLISEIKNLIASDEFQSAADKATALGMLNAVYAKGTTDTTGNLISTNVYSAAQEATKVNVSIKTADATLKQLDYSDVSGGKNLQLKMAGIDNSLSAGDFIGWDIAASTFEYVKSGETVTIEGERSKPNALIQQWFDILAERAGDNDLDTGYVTEEGVDLQQLVQKFLLGAVTYSQASEDYLKKDKGLMKQNSKEDGNGKSYTSLEHQWDEGFGYFGAAHDYNLYTDAQNKAQQDNDTNLDGSIDLYSEYSFGHSANAAKRDAGATVATDFSKGAMDAFITGRALIQANFGTDPVLGEDYQAELVEISKAALNNWEKAVAATVVHYINDVVADYETFGTPNFDAAAKVNLAKHWSEMKGFALGLQFSQVPVISVADLKTVHAAMGEAPELANKDAVSAYIVKLQSARDVMQSAYAFNAENVANW